MASRIEQIIEEIEEYIDGCKFQALSSTKIVVNKEELEEMLRELRMKTPDEIKRYQKIISNKDAILADAQQKADTIIADAQAKADKIVSESEVMQKALEQSNRLIEQTNQQAQEIVDKATTDANNIRVSAIAYTDETGHGTITSSILFSPAMTLSRRTAGSFPRSLRHPVIRRSRMSAKRIRRKTKQPIRKKTKRKTRSDRQAALLRRQEDDEASVGRQMPLVVKAATHHRVRSMR